MFNCVLADTFNANETQEKGARIYGERCVLCHGSQGMGGGVLALKLRDYPSTNLLESKRYTTREQIKYAVNYGGTKGDMSIYMPPMGQHLTIDQVNAVVEYIIMLREENEAAKQLLIEQESKLQPSRREGGQIFQTRCILCHGKGGKGDGRMARIIKSPPPADLTVSQLTDDKLIEIIAKGGQGVGRSPQMPPWVDQLSLKEIKSVILYIKRLRN